MIAINECVNDVQKIRDHHVTFVGNRIRKVIDFYLDIFSLLKDIRRNPRMKKQTVNSRVLKSKRNNGLDDYKYLLNGILKKSYAIKKQETIYHIKYENTRHKAANKIEEIISALTDLKDDYKSILEINFCENFTAWNRFYRICELAFVDLEFLYPYIFDYDNWFSKLSLKTSWGPYQLTRKLNMNACPYCNRQYIFTVSKIGGDKIARPELDHFLPKSSNPILALSFYNLIPSCSVCNGSVKGSTPIDYETHLSPYSENHLHSLIRFTYYPKSYEASIGMDENLTVEAMYNGDPLDPQLKKKVLGNVELFCINDLYTYHADVVQEIIRKRTISNDCYIQTLQSTFHSLNLSVEDAYRLAFGNYYNESEFHRRTLSKLTKDIAIELQTLKIFKK